MGAYVNPKDISKEEWLEKEGERIVGLIPTTIYTNEKLKIYTNKLGEILVQNKDNRNVTIRISPQEDKLQLTVHRGPLTTKSGNKLPSVLI